MPGVASRAGAPRLKRMGAGNTMDFQVVIDSLVSILVGIVNFIPNLINGIIILLVGYAVAGIVRWVLLVSLRRLNFDPLTERIGVAGALRGVGVKTPGSQLLAQLIFAFLLLSFFITATRIMGLEAVARLLEQLLIFLPDMLAAGIIFVLGGMAAQFVGNLVSAFGATSGVAGAKRLGQFVQYLISLFVLVLALSQLGVDTSILVTAITIGIAAIGLAFGLAFGLGARDIVHHVLAGYYVRQRFAIGSPVVLAEGSGTISSVGGLNTVVTLTSGDSLIIPNRTLVEMQVRAPAPPAAS